MTMTNRIYRFTETIDDMEHIVEVGPRHGIGDYLPYRSIVIWRMGEAGHLRWNRDKDPDLRLGLFCYPNEIKQRILQYDRSSI